MQGSVLGPLLFLAHINDLPECVKSSTARLFADGCAVYKRITSPQDAALLQDDKKLSFNIHVDITTKKANSIQALLQPNFNNCSRKIKEATNKTYVRPMVECATTADRRSSVTALLKDLQWPTLQSRRCQSRLAMYALQNPLGPGRYQVETTSH
ncbi:uncharacterized protein LOC115928047 [Strongylocentrotus purpuratus]|uniref:Reverse transcriptase domain-containing protein n=1 Tax=Strongylocentrotus purpuratus TaxID=7668 RepID=A0A7M7PJW1_STRPU|nr:uncharacterized protein LOC115928047 [Strongylocentrotus purpuratus]